jgi:cell division inhibitor SepF
MSGMWSRTLVYLGLREEPDEDYDELPERFVPEDDPYAEHAPARPTVGARAGATAAAAGRPAEPVPVRSVSPLDGAASNVRPLRSGDLLTQPASSAPLARAAVVEVEVFDDVEAVGARYRTGQPVLFDVSGSDTATARRVVDFVSGLTYALRGKLTKVGARAFLLVPDGVELPADELRRLGDLGYRLPAGREA